MQPKRTKKSLMIRIRDGLTSSRSDKMLHAGRQRVGRVSVGGWRAGGTVAWWLGQELVRRDLEDEKLESRGAQGWHGDFVYTVKNGIKRYKGLYQFIRLSNAKCQKSTFDVIETE
jgi:hypothetical protein